MRILRLDNEAQLFFNLASQQKCKVSTLLGFRSHEEAMSNNEIEWWKAYNSIRPLEPQRLDMMEARIIASSCGESPKDVLIDWFDPMRDEQYEREYHEEVLSELRELEARKKEKSKWLQR